MKPATWQWIGRISVESALIVFAVVLGFLVNAWREETRAHAEAQAAIERIKIELRANRDAVARVLPYHQQVAAALKSLRRNPPQRTLLDAFMEVAPRGVGDVLLADEAWKTAQLRNALASAEFETVQAIAAVYDIAESGVSSSWRAILEDFGEREFFLPLQDNVALERLIFAYETLISQERYLLGRYEAVLKKLRTAEEAETARQGMTLSPG